MQYQKKKRKKNFLDYKLQTLTSYSSQNNYLRGINNTMHSISCKTLKPELVVPNLRCFNHGGSGPFKKANKQTNKQAKNQTPKP